MERIASFCVDHTRLHKGMYTSRIDGTDIVTYDIRMKEPNKGDYLDTGTAHTFEHIFATFARSGSFADRVIYVGPMGCRTGFYLVVQGLAQQDAIDLVRSSLDFISAFSGDIPGASEAECGNYKDQNLPGAKRAAADMAAVLKDWTPAKLAYTR